MQNILRGGIKMDFVAGVGIINVDILYSGIKNLPNEGEEVYSKDFDIQLGGGVPATLINLQRLGIPTKISTFLGNDMLSNYAKEQLDGYHLKYDNMYEGDGMPLTITSIITTQRDRTFISYRDCPPITKEVQDKIYDKLKGAKMADMHIGFLEVYKRLKADGTTLIFDVGWEEGMSLEKYSEYLELADYFTPNQKEALKITGSSDLTEAATKLKKYFDKVIIKLDKDGCMCVEGDSTYIVPPMPNIKAVDATGAGDAFLSGFIYGLYHEYPVKDAILFGNITGGTCVQGVGCLTSYVNEKELLELARK